MRWPDCSMARHLLRRAPAAALTLLAALSASCVTVYAPHVAPLGQDRAPTDSTPLKVHLKSGELIVASAWTEDVEARTLTIIGERFSVDRRSLGSVPVTLPVDSIALVESHSERNVAAPGLAMLAIWSGISVATGVSCVADPKSCFGSCPTFYLDGDTSVIQAEGFSASPLRVLEATDVDHLFNVRLRDGPFVLRMRNEALETQAVRSVRLLLAPRIDGGRVLHAPDGSFHVARAIAPPRRCGVGGTDCGAAVATVDGSEWKSATDSADLAVRDSMELVFDRPPGATGAATIDSLGLVLGARHTLVSTFLFYQAIAFTGRHAAEALARMEATTPGQEPPLFAALRELGTITAEVAQPDGTWSPLGALFEAGPLATDVQLLPFAVPAGDGPIRVRLSLTRGYWRINAVALARRGARVVPLVLTPVAVTSVATPSRPSAAALAALTDSVRLLVTQTGDEYALRFDVPAPTTDASDGWEVFLESRGYYYELMREAWLADEDPLRAAAMLQAPWQAFRSLAPAFKAREAQMERAFWQSRVSRRRP